jgi:hypothetical protein
LPVTSPMWKVDRHTRASLLPSRTNSPGPAARLASPAAATAAATSAGLRSLPAPAAAVSEGLRCRPRCCCCC